MSGRRHHDARLEYGSWTVSSASRVDLAGTPHVADDQLEDDPVKPPYIRRRRQLLYLIGSVFLLLHAAEAWVKLA